LRDNKWTNKQKKNISWKDYFLPTFRNNCF